MPVLALVGGADPQDPVTNLSNLKQHFPDSRTVVFPHIGHEFNIGGCVDEMMADFVDRGTTKASIQPAAKGRSSCHRSP